MSSTYLNFILKSVLLLKPKFVEFSFVKVSSSINSIGGVPFAGELFESIKHSTISKLANVSVPDTIEDNVVFFSLPSMTKGAASNLQ